MNRPTADKRLFTPGPLTTSPSVKAAMLRDLGSRDAAFIETVRGLRHQLLSIAGVSQAAGYEAILMQGSGTFGLESVIASTVRPGERLLVLVNGAYGRRVVQMAERLGIDTVTCDFPEDTPVDPAVVRQSLAAHEGITHVSVVHCETTTGLLNPVEAVGEIVQAAGAFYLVDAMSSFGAIEIDVQAAGIDFLVTSANKCLEGVPGFAIVLARREALLATEGAARSLSLDLHAQWRGLEKNGQFRFTPPTHTMLALAQALQELTEEGGVEGRAARYRANHDALMDGMQALGFRPYLASDVQSYIITAFYYPDDPNFDFEDFYARLNDRGLVIYPGKVSRADLFRIGSIGRLFPSDMEALVAAMRETLGEMGVRSLAGTPGA